MKLTLLFALALTAYGQAVINAPAITLNATGADATRAWMVTQFQGAETKLALPATIGATTITVVSGVGINTGSVLIIGTEMLDVTAKAGAVLTVTRSINGTVSAAYVAGVDAKESKFKSFNHLGRMLIMGALKQLVGTSTLVTGPVTTAQTNANAAVESAVQ